MTILLIDDEFLVLKGLETILNAQKEFPAHVVPYIDSVEALAALPTVKPDVVVIDICMPELGGLDFIERARAQGYAGHFIIVSGYEELPYLKRALELQVVTYLTKPVDKRKLIETLRVLSQSQVTMEQLLDRLQYLLSIPASSHRTYYSAADWERLFPKPAVALIAAHHIVRPALRAEAFAQLDAYFEPVYALQRQGMDLYLLALPVGVQREDICAVVDRLQHREPDCWYGLSDIHFQSDIVAQIVRGEGLPLLLEAACDAVRRELALPAGMADQPELEVARAFLRQPPRDAFKAMLIECSRAGLSKEAWFTRCFTEIVAALLLRGEPFLTQGRLHVFYEMLWDDDLSTIELCDTLAALHEHYLRFLRQTVDTDRKYSPKIARAVLYISGHFSEDLSLNAVAGAVGLNHSYFSALFRKEVGMPFLGYLKQVRMEEACRLLETSPDLPVETVARRVGYQTIGQFYKVFRSTFHESPKNWQEHALEKHARERGQDARP